MHTQLIKAEMPGYNLPCSFCALEALCFIYVTICTHVYSMHVRTYVCRRYVYVFQISTGLESASIHADLYLVHKSWRSCILTVCMNGSGTVHSSVPCSVSTVNLAFPWCFRIASLEATNAAIPSSPISSKQQRNDILYLISCANPSIMYSINTKIPSPLSRIESPNQILTLPLTRATESAHTRKVLVIAYQRRLSLVFTDQGGVGYGEDERRRLRPTNPKSVQHGDLTPYQAVASISRLDLLSASTCSTSLSMHTQSDSALKWIFFCSLLTAVQL